MGAYGSIQAGKQEQAIDNYNAKVLAIQAQEAEAAGIIEVGNIEQYGVRLASAQRAAAAKAGVLATSGSALQVALDSSAAVETDKRIAAYNTSIGVKRLQSESFMQTYMGNVARLQSKFQAGMSLLQQGSKIASYWSQGSGATGGGGVGNRNESGLSYGSGYSGNTGNSLGDYAANYMSNR